MRLPVSAASSYMTFILCAAFAAGAQETVSRSGELAYRGAESLTAQVCRVPSAAADPAVASANSTPIVVRALPSPTETCGDIAWDGSSLWVTDWQAGQLLRIDPADGHLLARLQAPCYRPRGLTWGAGRLYIADDFEGKIYVLDVATGRVVTTYVLPSGSALGLAWDGEALWVADDAGQTLQRLIPTDGTILSSLPAPDSEPGGLAYDGEYLWITARLRDRVYLADPRRQKIISSFDSPGPYPCGLAPADSGRVWLADFETGEIYLCAPRQAARYQTRDWRETSVRMTYRLDNHGPGRIVGAEVHFAIPDAELENQITTGEPTFFGPVQPEIWTDEWGQGIATFRVDAVPTDQSLEAGYEARAVVADLNYLIIPELVGRLDDIPRDIRERYTVEGDRLQVGSQIVRDTSRRVVGSETNPYWIARLLYEWVIDTLTYELGGGWDVPETLIQRGTGSCSEYTFLFIALCRAAGLPARYEAGTSLRGDDTSVDDVHHRWAEVYLPGYGWVPCDPSRGDSPVAGDRADAFGRLNNRLFITTHSGGGSRALAWTYNARATFATEGHCDFTEDEWVMWRRAKEEGAAIVPSRAQPNLDPRLGPLP